MVLRFGVGIDDTGACNFGSCGVYLPVHEFLGAGFAGLQPGWPFDNAGNADATFVGLTFVAAVGGGKATCGGTPLASHYQRGVLSRGRVNGADSG